jgi:DNA polymerase-3 subunit alpha
MGKKEPEVMDQQHRNFVTGAVANRISEELAERIFSKIAYFAGYGFNKSHSAAYALLSYQTAYLKSKYPMEFMAACLTSEIGNTDRIVVLMDECRRMGITVLPPDIDRSTADFTVSDEGIRFGLAAIKNVGRSAIESITAARDRHGRFRTIFELCEKVDLRAVNKRVLESLICAGAMDSLEGHRAQLLEAVESAMSVGQKVQRDRSTGQTSLLKILETHGEKNGIERSLPGVVPWSMMEKLRRERDILGFYCSGHPLSRYRREIDAFTTSSVAAATSLKDGRAVILAGVITGKRIHLGRDGQKIGFVGLEDLTGQIETVFFSDQLKAGGDGLATGQMILVSGTVSYRNEEQPKIRVSDYVELEASIGLLTRAVEIDLDSVRLTDSALDLLRDVLNANPGDARVSVVVMSEGHDVTIELAGGGVKPSRELVHALDGIEGVASLRLVPRRRRHGRLR